MGRPRKEIDKRAFEHLCGLQCTKEEICSFLEVSDKTLDKWCQRTYKESFSEIFRQKRGLGKISLRRHQFQLAEKNAAMAIFLGKNILGQRDVAEEEANKATLAKVDAILLSLTEYASREKPCD